MKSKNKNSIFDSYLTNHYSNCERTNFSNEKDVIALLQKNSKPIRKNLGWYFNKINNKNIKVLDLGCGYGNFLYFMQSNHINNVTGVDVSSEEIMLCKKLFNKYKFFNKDIISFINNTKDRFDVIYISHVLEHFNKDQILSILKGIRTLLTNNGVLIIIVPNSSSYFNSLSARYGDFTHEIGFSDKSLNQILLQSKFNNIYISNFVGVGNFWVNILRKISLFAFEIFVQILGYDKQNIYTPSIMVMANKHGGLTISK